MIHNVAIKIVDFLSKYGTAQKESGVRTFSCRYLKKKSKTIAFAPVYFCFPSFLTQNPLLA